MPSYTAKTKATRFLRKYTASADTPVYAAAVDAQTCVLSLCDVPWSKALAPGEAFPSHDADSLDENVENRDSFDAALFCAGHKGGKHRAYANACCYRFRVPDAGIGATLEGISFTVASDPYNAAGLRINVFTNSTGDIPMDCHELRGEDSEGAIIDENCTAAGAVPRTTQTDADGTEYWYAASGTVSLAPDILLDKYLFVLVALENYNTSRGNWLEGSGFARNSFTLTTDTEIDWEEQDPASSGSYAAIAEGSLPPIPAGEATGRRKAAFNDSDINLAYRLFLTGGGDAETAPLPPGVAAHAGHEQDEQQGDGALDAQQADVTQAVLASFPAPGAMFNVRCAPVSHQGAPRTSWQIASSVFRAPFAMPGSFTPSKLRISIPFLDIDEGASFAVWLAQDWLNAVPQDTIRDPALYDARSQIGGLRLLGRISSQGAHDFALEQDEAAARFLTVVVSAFFPPDAVSRSSTGWQGTRGEVFPAISIIQ